RSLPTRTPRDATDACTSTAAVSGCGAITSSAGVTRSCDLPPRPPRRPRRDAMKRSEIETLDAATSTLTLSLDVGLYPRDVLYAAAYVFLDRAYVLLDRIDSRFVVHLRGKRLLDEGLLQAMAGEFENELLAQALRHQVVDANQRIIEEVVEVAIAGAAGEVE